MIVDSQGYVYRKKEWYRYHNFKPSLLQKIVWFFFPSLTSINIERYKNVKIEDLID